VYVFNKGDKVNMSKYYGSSKKYADILTVLLVIIIIAILGLVGYFGYKALNKKTVEANAKNALEEFKKNTPTISVADDDTDETPTDSSNVSLDDIINNEPTNTTTNTSTTTSSSSVKKTYLGNYEIKGSISIPKTGIEYPILERVTTDSLTKSVAIMDIQASSELGTTVNDLNVPGTNAYIMGHNYRNGMFFSNNDKLSIGDKIKITDQTGLTVTYTIYQMYYTSPNDVEFMSRDIDINTREITLQTCNNDSSQRLIILAKDN
jgi:LPXTG-site transpeptidase (sortase) family protein